MKIAGIVAEYNPFHNGHAYQINTLRSMGYDAVICVCSPSVVQRGSAALFPTAVRTSAALAGGADLVISLPAPFACKSAEGFAQAAIRLLYATGVCNTIAFGAENANTWLLMQVAALLRTNEFSKALKIAISQNPNASFAHIRSQVAADFLPEAKHVLETPNNILGVEYCKVLLSLSGENSTPANPLAILRNGATHDAPLSSAKRTYASASAIRTLFNGSGVDVNALSTYVPKNCLPIYKQAIQKGLFLQNEKLETAILSRLRSKTSEDFAKIRNVNEGLENRLYSAVQAEVNLVGLYDNLKTKRYAHSRLRRLVLDATLNYTNDLPSTPAYIHVLGASPKGLEVLKLIKNEDCAKLPISQSLVRLANTSEGAKQIATAHAQAEDFTGLCLKTPQKCGRTYTQKFIVAK